MALEDIVAVIGALGGLGVISAGIAAWVGNLVSSRVIEKQKAILTEQLETHKDMLLREADRNRLLLKRQELMFEREFDASVAFLKLQNRVVPESWAPDLDWSDAQVRIAERLSAYDMNLRKLIDRHSVALSTEARKLIASAKSVANSGSFEVAQETVGGDYEPGSYPSDTVCKLVDEFYQIMNKAEAQVRQDLKVGTFGD